VAVFLTFGFPAPVLFWYWFDSRGQLLLSSDRLEVKARLTRLTIFIRDIADIQMVETGLIDEGVVQIALRQGPRLNPVMSSRSSTRGFGIPGILPKKYAYCIRAPAQFIEAYTEFRAREASQ
jgi:hypothetical protein